MHLEKRVPRAYSRPWWRLGSLVVALLFAAPLSAQQTGTVTGMVTDLSGGAPLNGVQVSIEGTGLGGLTDARGRYAIPNVPAGTHNVRVTLIGYRTESKQVTVGAGQSATADFQLGVSAVSLDEVVVTGTAGAVEKKQLGATVSTVSVASVQEKVPVTDVGSVLSARIPGLRSIGTVGGVGASKDLRIRGTSSFNLGQRPVVYIDGVKVDTRQREWQAMGTSCCSYSGGAGTDRLNDLNPNDIERIEVIKGAAAGTLYGTEATNGVIQIFTKKGRSDSAPRWTAQLTTGFQRNRENIQTKLWPLFTGPDGTRALDANKSLIENGPYLGADLTVQGGGQNMTYFISGGYSNEQGSIQPNGMQRGNLRLNMHWLASQKISFDVTSSYARNRLIELQSGNNWTSLLGNAVLGVPYQACTTGCVDQFARPYGEPWVPIAAIKEIETYDDANRWTGGLTANLNPTSNFTNRFQVGLDAVSEERTYLRPFGYPYTYVPTGEKSLGYRNFRSVTADYLGAVDFNDVLPRLSTKVSFGAQGFRTTERFNTAVGRDYAAPGVTTVRGGAVRGGDEVFEEVVQVGVFGQNRFAYADKLYLTTGVRVDGNSAFGDNYGFEVYPNVQLSYDMTQERFLPTFLSSLRLRGAVGTAGLAPGAFDKFLTFEPFTTGDDESGVRADESGNQDLGPERTTEIETGFEAGFWNDRIGLDVTVYRRTTKDAIAAVAIAPSLQFGDASDQNIGTIRDQGYEISLRVTPLETSRIRWSTDLRLDGNDNKITDLGMEADTAVQRRGNFRLGLPVRTLFARILCTPELAALPVGDPRSGGCTGKQGWNPTTRTFTRTDTTMYIGRVLPTFNASLGNEITFGAFRLYGLLTMERGAWFNNSDRPYRANFRSGDEYLALLATEGSADCFATQPSALRGTGFCETAASDSLYNYFRALGSLDKRDNVRIRELSVTYQIAEALTGRLGLGRTQLTLAAQNLHWWDDCNCMDPNMVYQGGRDIGGAESAGFLAQPQARMFKLSVRTSF